MSPFGYFSVMARCQTCVRLRDQKRTFANAPDFHGFAPRARASACVEHAIDHLAGKPKIVRGIAMAADGIDAAKRVGDFGHASENIGEIAAPLDRLSAG